MSRLSQLPSDSVCDVWIRAGTASRIWNPLERNNPTRRVPVKGRDGVGVARHRRSDVMVVVRVSGPYAGAVVISAWRRSLSVVAGTKLQHLKERF
jgi:hypothetical protein